MSDEMLSKMGDGRLDKMYNRKNYDKFDKIHEEKQRETQHKDCRKLKFEES